MSGAALRIATRNSRLALWQAEHVAALLKTAHPDRDVELVEVSTVGDRDQSVPLASLGGFGVFTREVQRAVLENRADIAVHSLKDLPTEPVDGLTLAAIPERGEVFDALVLPRGHDEGTSLDSLSAGVRIGTGSPRRRAQLLHARNDLLTDDVRGNVETRLRKLDAGEYDALVLARAGLCRLGLADRINTTLSPPVMFPAVAQGALGLECRQDDDETRTSLEAISHHDTAAAATAERRLLAELRAGCHAPVGVQTTIDGVQMTIEGVVLSADGVERIVASVTGAVQEAPALGTRLAAELRDRGADPLVAAPEA